jgi:hypothetical protein
MASTSWGVRALRHGQARTVALSRVLARLFLTLRRSWLVDVVVFGGAPGGPTQLTFNVRGSNARRAVRAYGSAGWTALGFTLVSEIVVLYNGTTRCTNLFTTHRIKGVNPCPGNTDHRPDEHRPAPPARPAPPTRARPGRPRGATRTGPRGRGGRGARGCQPRAGRSTVGARKPQRAQEHRRRPLHRTRM